MKITVLLPKTKKDKFAMRCTPYGRSFKTAPGLLRGISGLLRAGKLKENSRIVVKRYEGSSWEIDNETLSLSNRKELLYVTSCFLEEYLTKPILKQYSL